MASDLTNNWPKLRIDPAVLERLRAVIADSSDKSASLIQVANSILRDALTQIESKDDKLAPLAIIRELREKTGRSAGADFYERLDELFRGLNQRVLTLEKGEIPDKKTRKKTPGA